MSILISVSSITGNSSDISEVIAAFPKMCPEVKEYDVILGLSDGRDIAKSCSEIFDVWDAFDDLAERVTSNWCAEDKDFADPFLRFCGFLEQIEKTKTETHREVIQFLAFKISEVMETVGNITPPQKWENKIELRTELLISCKEAFEGTNAPELPTSIRYQKAQKFPFG